MTFKSSAFGLALLLSWSGAAFSKTWKIDPAHSIANFRVRHMTVTWVRGTIAGIEGKIESDEADYTKSKIVATLDANTIDTRDAKRDNHLRGPDFLDVAKNPKIKFESKSITGANGNFKVYGQLTLNGVTKDVVMAVEGPTPAVKSPYGDQRRGLTANTTINRKDFNITWNQSLDAGGVVVGDQIGITLELELTDKVTTSH